MTTHPSDDAARPLSRREAREAAQAPEGHARSVPAVSPSAPPQAIPPVADEVREPNEFDADTTAVHEALSPKAETSAVRRAVATEDRGVDLDDLFESNADQPPKRRGGCLVGLIIVLAIIAGLAGGGIWAWSTYGDKIQEFFGMSTSEDYDSGMAEGEVLFTINSGDGGIEISQALHAAGVTKSPKVFYDWLRANPPSPTFFPGTYLLQEKMTAEAAATILRNLDNKIANTVLLREGETMETILPTISETLDIALADLQAAAADPSVYDIKAATLEGWLFPATYEFEENVTANDVISTMIDRTVQSLDEAGVPVEDRQKILTVASIIQREAGAGDMGKVARVIYNRLGPDNVETFGLLQMDSTVAYGVGKLHGGVVATTDADRADDNPYNTYLHTGLPAGPISNAGDEAITAAMYPEAGPWFYFVTINLDTGETVFSETYDDQLDAEKLWHDWCDKNPDSGCYAP